MRLQYFEWSECYLGQLQEHMGLRRLFNYLVVQQGGDVNASMEILQHLQRSGQLSQDLDLDDFARRLEKENVIAPKDGEYVLTVRGERDLRREALENIFSGMRKRGIGEHATGHAGAGSEILGETRSYEFGDDLNRIDFRRSFENALRRDSDLTAGLRPEDLEVFETENRTSCATVLLLDISHSMILYGEDRITPAKRVALALTELILTRYPKDSIDLVLFGDDAHEVKVADLPYVTVGPFHTNTRAGLQMARRLLSRRKHPNKQVIMITDGKPSCIYEDGKLFKNSFGLDPKIVNRTLDEAVILRRQQIPITTFMVARDPYLQGFVRQLTKLNRGRAYFASLDHLDEYVMVDFMRNRRGRLH